MGTWINGVEVLSSPKISGGTINGATIGATTPAAGTFTTLTGATVAGGMIATDAETITGTATDHLVTPANVTARLASPPAIGGTLAAAGTFTTITGTTIDATTDVTIKGTTGGYVRKFAEATSGALSGATGSIAVNVPAGARILGVQLRVDTAITSAAAVSWSADYVNTPTTAICSGQAFAKNTKYNAVHPAYEITTDTVTITITPNADTFTGGVVRAIVYYETIDAMGDAA